MISKRNFTLIAFFIVGFVLSVAAIQQHSLHSSFPVDIQNPNTWKVPEAEFESAPYADWAHKHWVWFASRYANQTSMLGLANDYLARNIPVGAVDLDSEWSTGVNNFVWDTEKYPDAKGMVDQFHAKDIKVICWATSMVDNTSSNFQEGKEKGYYLNDGKLIKWWHGHGAFMDYTNPEALAWWHKQMDSALDAGIDGWKCDGTDPYVFELVVPHGHKGIITEREYADSYYRDFFDYTRQKRGQEGLIMSRPVDSFDNLIFWKFSPREVVLSGWVGDADPTFNGLEQVMARIVHSAWDKYPNFGSDIGGYRMYPTKPRPPLGRTTELFTRWFQMGAFVPLMENGGEGEHRPWMFDEPGSNTTLDTYRIFVSNHMDLVPYLLTTGTNALENDHSSITPLAEKTEFVPDRFDYLLGPSIYVSPIITNGTRSQKIQFPSGANWVDWWDKSKVFQGGQTVDYNVPLNQFPAFHKAGDLIPLHVESHFGGHGDETHANAYTMWVHSPMDESDTIVREHQGNGLQVWYSRTVMDGHLHLAATAHHKQIIFLIQGVSEPERVIDLVASHDGELPQASSRQQLGEKKLGWFYDHEKSELIVRPPIDQASGTLIQLKGCENLFV